MVHTRSNQKELDQRTCFIRNARRIVLKLGTRVLLHHYHSPDRSGLVNLVRALASYHRLGYRFTIVTSGAVGFGMTSLGLDSRPRDLRKIQALASVGQGILMQKWNDLFQAEGFRAGQILLTYDIIENRRRYLHARDCLCEVLELGAIPIINENDSVAVDELRVGDNDTLSALTAMLMEADLLVLFTDTDGVFTANPFKSQDAHRISYMDRVDAAFVDTIQDRENPLSIGGMRSKLQAAGRAAMMGTGVLIADGLNPDLDGLLSGKDIGTFIQPSARYEKKRKRWIYFNHKMKGRIMVDAGAERALVMHQKSLLPGGITDVWGRFDAGAIVGIYNPDEVLIAKGIATLSSDQIERIKGMKTGTIRAEYGDITADEVVHRDNMIVVEQEIE